MIAENSFVDCEIRPKRSIYMPHSDGPMDKSELIQIGFYLFTRKEKKSITQQTVITIYIYPLALFIVTLSIHLLDFSIKNICFISLAYFR